MLRISWSWLARLSLWELSVICKLFATHCVCVLFGICRHLCSQFVVSSVRFSCVSATATYEFLPSFHLHIVKVSSCWGNILMRTCTEDTFIV